MEIDRTKVGYAFLLFKHFVIYAATKLILSFEIIFIDISVIILIHNLENIQIEWSE